jgi:hypothetical protein
MLASTVQTNNQVKNEEADGNQGFSIRMDHNITTYKKSFKYTNKK